MSATIELKYGIEKYSGPQIPSFRVVLEADKLKTEANELLSKGLIHEAITQYRAAASIIETGYGKSINKAWEKEKLDPVKLALLLNLSLAYLKANDSKGALFFAEKAITLNSTSTKARYRKAMAFKLEGEYESAVEELQKAQEIDSNEVGIREEIRKLQEIIRKEKKEQGRVFAQMINGVTTQEEMRKEKEERERKQQIEERTAKTIATLKPLKPKQEQEHENAAEERKKSPFIGEIQLLERRIDESENQLRQLLMLKVKEEKIADVEEINQDLDEWSNALSRMEYMERIALAKDLFEIRKFLEKTIGIIERADIPETVERLEEQYMGALRELKEQVDDAGDELGLEKLEKLKEKVQRLVKRFEFRKTLQRVVDMTYSCAAGCDITKKKEGNAQETMEKLTDFEHSNCGF